MYHSLWGCPQLNYHRKNQFFDVLLMVRWKDLSQADVQSLSMEPTEVPPYTHFIANTKPYAITPETRIEVLAKERADVEQVQIVAHSLCSVLQQINESASSVFLQGYVMYHSS
jgi:hypothetical protein